MTTTLKAERLTSARFSPYGQVIESSGAESDEMNTAYFERFDNLCDVDMANDGRVAVSIARCRTPTSLPVTVDKVERHPLGSQAFIPLSPCKVVIVVAPPGESVDVNDLRAFVSDGRQGFNYRRGTWHMPLISFAAGQEYLIIDRSGDEPNCEELILGGDIVLEVD